jgi:hypothetical protein
MTIKQLYDYLGNLIKEGKGGRKGGKEIIR